MVGAPHYEPPYCRKKILLMKEEGHMVSTYFNLFTNAINCKAKDESDKESIFPQLDDIEGLDGDWKYDRLRALYSRPCRPKSFALHWTLDFACYIGKHIARLID